MNHGSLFYNGFLWILVDSGGFWWMTKPYVNDFVLFLLLSEILGPRNSVTVRRPQQPMGMVLDSCCLPLPEKCLVHLV